MKKQFFAILLSILFFNACQSGANSDKMEDDLDSLKAETDSLPQYKLVWADEFETVGLPDTTKWSYDIGGHGWGNNEAQFYTQSRKENARVENGKLIIEARKEKWEGKKFTSARLVSKNKGDWKYGRFEIRAKLPQGRGVWPAIWMLPTVWDLGGKGWPDNGEIDIMEYVGYAKDTIHGTIHCKDYNHVIGTQKGKNIQIQGVENDFHNYILEWTDSKIEIFVDDKKYFEFAKEEGWEKWPFFKEFHLILNIAVGGNWGGKYGIDETGYPKRMEIDYVRVYQNN